MGGVARRATLIDESRSANEHVLVLDAGHALLDDSTRPSEIPGEISAQALDLMGYDAVALGSEDLANLGVDGVSRIRDAHAFALLSANAYPADSDELIADPYLLVDIDGHRIGILGLTDAREVPGWAIADPVDAARETVRALRRKVDIIILLSHAGQAVDREIARRVRGIDVIVVGGNQLLPEPVRLGSDATLLIHADRYAAGVAGENLGVAKLTFDEQGELSDNVWERVPLTEDVGESAEINAWLLELGH